MLNPELLDILCCPLGKAGLKLKDNFLVCTKCGVKYPVREGIPVLLIDEAVLPEGITKIDQLECVKSTHDDS